MFARALVAILVLPGMAAVVAPLLISSLDPWRGGRCVYGVGVMLGGAFVLLWCVRDFYVAGKGTLAPWDPPKSLVVVGLYRWIRNPMYIGVLVLVLGWAIFLASVPVAVYCAVLALVFHVRVVKYEEPGLKSRFPEEWAAYSVQTSRWLPRVRLWKNSS